MKLYEINEEIQRLTDQIGFDEETGELLGDAEDLLRQIDSLQMERKSILEYLAKLVLNLRAEETALKGEEARLKDRRSRLEKKEGRLLQILDRECHGEKTDLGVATLNYRYGFIEKFIEKLGERFNIREIAYDRWGAVQMVQNLEGMGFTVVSFGQGYKDMSPTTKELMKLVLEKRIAHGGHPVLRWMADNIFIKTDEAGNIKPDKAKSTEKIDGIVATVMALDRAIRCGNESPESVYDSRGLLFV